MTLREHTGRTVEFKLVDRNTNIDFAEDWLNAGLCSVTLMERILLTTSIIFAITQKMQSRDAIQM